MFPKNWPQNLVHIVTSSISLSFISQSCKGALPGHNQPLRFLWPFWLPSNSKEWTIPPVWTKSPGYSRFGERRTPLVVVAWGTTASIQVNIYSFFKRWGGKAEVFGNSGQTINIKVHLEMTLRVSWWDVRTGVRFSWTAFPWSQSSTGQQKKLIHNHPGGLLLKRESFAGFANWSPSKLNKQKTSTASSLFLQHGLLHYENWQCQEGLTYRQVSVTLANRHVRVPEH